MINFLLSSYLHGRSVLIHEAVSAKDKALQIPHDPVPAAEKAITESNIRDALRRIVDDAKFDLGKPPFDFDFIMAGQPTWNELYIILYRIREELERAEHTEFFHHYSSEGAQVVQSIVSDWNPVLTEFRHSRKEIECGVDCYALGDYAGCIFHMMRTAEIGMREVAKKLKVRTVKNKKPIEYAMWGHVIAALHQSIENLVNAKGNTKPLNNTQI